MGFFSTLADNVKQLFSSDSVDNLKASTTVKPQSGVSFSASAIDTLLGEQSGGFNLTGTKNQSKEVNQSKPQTVGTPLSPALSLTSTSNKGSTPSYAPRPLSAPVKASTAQSGVSGKSTSNVSVSGNRSVAPKVVRPTSGVSGVTGESTQQFIGPSVGQRSLSSFNSTSQIQTSGLAGISGGGSNFTGNLGASGGASTSLTLGQSEEDKKRQDAQTQVINPATGQNTGVMPPNVLQTTPTYNSIASKPTTTNFTTTPPTGAINLDTLSQGLQNISSAISSKGTFNAADIQGFYDQVQSYQDQLTQYNLQQEGIMAEPFVAETLEQTQWLDSQPTDFRAQFDQVYKDSGLADINANITAKQAQINATNTAFQQIIKDIQDNPELPKGLAAKRISDFVDRNAIQLQNMNAELANLISSRDYANDQVNQYYGIIKDQAAEDARKREANQSLLNNFIQSGAIANFSDKALEQASIATGISVSALKAAKKSVVDKQKDYSNFYTQTNDAGDLTIIGVDNKGNAKVLSTVKGVAGTKSTGGTGGLTSYQEFQGALSLKGQLNKSTDAAKEILRYTSLMNDAYGRYTSGEAKDLNATSQTIINSFSKILDPSSVVRESEYARSGDGVSLIQKIEGIGAKISQGGAGLTPKALKEFVDTANLFASRASAAVEQERQSAIALANQYGIDTSFVGGGYVPSAGGQLTPGATGTTSSGMSYTIEQ